MKDNGKKSTSQWQPLWPVIRLKVGCAFLYIRQPAQTEYRLSVRWTDAEMIQQCRDGICALTLSTLTLQSVELAGAVLSRDVLPVGTAGQGHHGAEGHGALAHLHLKLQSSKLVWRRQSKNRANTGCKNFPWNSQHGLSLPPSAHTSSDGWLQG